MTSNRIRTIEGGFIPFLLKFILLSGWRHLTDRMTSSYWWDGIIFLTGWRHLSDRMTSSYWRDGVILPAELVHLYLYQLHKRLFNSSVSDFLGTAGDSLSVHHDQSFSTQNRMELRTGTAPRSIKELGGTIVVATQTWMACIMTEVPFNSRMVWPGTTGRDINTPLRWLKTVSSTF